LDLHGKLVVFEGLDFTGKSTQVRILGRRLRELGYNVAITREPGGTAIGEQIRKVVLSGSNTQLLPISELLLFMICRAQLWKEIVHPALERGDVVLSSRFRDSSLMYQGYGRGITPTLIEQLNDQVTEGKRADVTFLIDLSVEEIMRRKPEVVDRIEQEGQAFYEEVRQGYLKAYGVRADLPLFPELVKFSFSEPVVSSYPETPDDEKVSLNGNFLARVRDGYLRAAARDSHFYVIDGRLPIELIAEQVAEHLNL
jgi:dTMP kinase